MQYSAVAENATVLENLKINKRHDYRNWTVAVRVSNVRAQNVLYPYVWTHAYINANVAAVYARHADATLPLRHQLYYLSSVSIKLLLLLPGMRN